MTKVSKTEKRSLRYDFTAVELHEKSLQLANKNKEVQELEDEKKTVTSQLQGKINAAKAEVNVLANQVSAGWEYKDIECDIIYHMPQEGKKTIIRKDTGKKTAIEAMTDLEWDLFNQHKDDVNKDEEKTEDAEFEEAENGPKLLGN